MQGLKNLGSTCAINSLIQIICRNKYLRNSLLNTDIPESTISFELKEILKILFIDKNSISPNKFIMYLYNIFQNFINIGEQIDITELWFLLFDKISSEIGINTIYINNHNNYDNIDLDNPLIYDKAIYTINKFNNFKTCSWLETSQGLILNIITCNSCHNISYSFEPFISIQLDLPNDNEQNTISLTSLFRNYLKTYVNKDEWKCDKCSLCSEYKKEQKLWRLPNVLIFFIKRYSNINKKNNAPIDINNNINIKKGCILENKNLELNYKLSSIALHYGDLNSGHYMAICHDDEKKKFILYDDLNVKIYDNNNNNFLTNNINVYMVLYCV